MFSKITPGIELGAASLSSPQPTIAEPASQPTTQVLECIECCRQWDVPSERWRVYVTEEEPREAVAYCPDCGEREFG